MAKQSRKRPKSARKRPGKGAGRAPRVNLASLSTASLAAELKRRQSELPKLQKQAATLRAELAEVLARIASLGGDAPSPSQALAGAASAKSVARGAPRRRLNGKPTIGEQIVEIVGGSSAVMSPRDIAAALGKRLAREVTTNFLVQISLTLARLVKQGRVKKVGRGQYAAGSGAAVASND